MQRKKEGPKNPRFLARLTQLIGDEKPYAWARRVGISKGAFTRMWHEGTPPAAELLERIKQETGVSIDWLLTGDGSVHAMQVGEERGAYGGKPVRALTREEEVLVEKYRLLTPQQRTLAQGLVAEMDSAKGLSKKKAS